MKKLFAYAIVFGMISVCFTLVPTTPVAGLSVIDNIGVTPMGIYPKDLAWNSDVTVALMVGNDNNGDGHCAAVYYADTNTWNMLALYPPGWAPGYTMEACVWSDTLAGGGAWACVGQARGIGTTSTFYIQAGTTDMQELPTPGTFPNNVLLEDVTTDNFGNLLVVGSGNADEVYFFRNSGGDWTYVANSDDPGFWNSCDYDYNNQRYYIAGEFDTLITLQYTEVVVDSTTQLFAHFVYGQTAEPGTSVSLKFNSNPALHPGANFGVILGSNTLLYSFTPVETAIHMEQPAMAPSMTFYDLAWNRNTWEEATFIGEISGNHTIYQYNSISDSFVAIYGQFGNPLYCVDYKPPSSPGWGMVLSGNGGMRININAFDIGTQIRVNSAFPHIFDINFWDQSSGFPGPSLLNQEVDVGSTYTFYLEGNYSVGGVDEWWSAAELELTAWYDEGHVFGASVPDGSFGTPDNRTRQFRVIFNPGANTSNLVYPMGFPGEFAIHSTFAHPNVFGGPGDYWHRVYINITFGLQTYAADGNTFVNVGAGDITDITQALDDPFSWDFNYSVYDSSFPSAREEAYEEFGIKQAVSIVAAGNPTGNAPPGSNNVPLTPDSTITYSSNAQYWVNVSIPDLLLNGVGPQNIPAGNVEIMNSNSWSATDGDISAWSAMPGVGNYLCVWGHVAGPTPLTPVLNGTQSAGPVVSDYTWFTGATYPDTTTLNWRVSVPAIPEGVYWATITFTVESI